MARLICARDPGAGKFVTTKQGNSAILDLLICLLALKTIQGPFPEKGFRQRRGRRYWRRPALFSGTEFVTPIIEGQSISPPLRNLGEVIRDQHHRAALAQPSPPTKEAEAFLVAFGA
jgi:hypothetical protein